MDERERLQDGGRRKADLGLGVGGGGGGCAEEKVEKEVSPSQNRLGSGNVQFLGFLHVAACLSADVWLLPPQRL